MVFHRLGMSIIAALSTIPGIHRDLHPGNVCLFCQDQQFVNRLTVRIDNVLTEPIWITNGIVTIIDWESVHHSEAPNMRRFEVSNFSGFEKFEFNPSEWFSFETLEGLRSILDKAKTLGGCGIEIREHGIPPHPLGERENFHSVFEVYPVGSVTADALGKAVSNNLSKTMTTRAKELLNQGEFFEGDFEKIRTYTDQLMDFY